MVRLILGVSCGLGRWGVALRRLGSGVEALREVRDRPKDAVDGRGGTQKAGRMPCELKIIARVDGEKRLLIFGKNTTTLLAGQGPLRRAAGV